MLKIFFFFRYFTTKVDMYIFHPKRGEFKDSLVYVFNTRCNVKIYGEKWDM